MNQLAKMRRRHNEFVRGLYRELSDASRLAESGARQAIAQSSDTNDTEAKAGVAVKRMAKVAGIWLQLGTSNKRAIWAEKGTKPHVISAQGKGRLRFQWGGATVFAKTVNHPGTEPTHFIKNAASITGARLGSRLVRATQKLARKFNRP